MAYVFSPDHDIGAPVSDGEGGYVIEFALGYIPEEDLIVLEAVMLTATGQPNILELHFGIRYRIGDSPASPPDYSKDAVDLYIPKASRAIITDLVRKSTARIVPAARPKSIVMETFYANLEPKALHKYDAICGAIGMCGYVLEQEFRGEDGKNYWIFAREGGNS